ncbi:response regulator [Burkholderiaceae bacterium UC74_6]
MTEQQGAGQPSPQGADTFEIRPSGGLPVNILLVDDDPANLVVLETVLESPDYRLVRAYSADQALLALMEQEFALLILDVHMPGMSGFELAQMIKDRKRTAHLPIIFLTAYYDRDQHMTEGYGSGAVDFLNKPVNPTVLRSKVAVFAELHRKDRAIRLSNLALQREVDERRQAEQRLSELNETLELRVAERGEALRAADRRLQAMLGSISDGLMLLDEHWRFSYLNEPGAQLLEARMEHMQGAGLWTLFPQLLGTAFERGLREAAASSSSMSFEAQLPGSTRWLQCHCYPSTDGLSVYFHDISNRRELEERREHLLAAEQAARSEGERLVRTKDEFLALLSHELRTPLAAILGWTNVLLRTDVDASTARRGVEAIARNTRLQAQLVSDLLDMSRISSGKLNMNIECVDLNEIAAAVGETADLACAEKQLRFELALDSDAPLLMMGDPGRVMQIISNLVTNAIKFTPAGGLVSIATSRIKHEAELRVTDTGLGIEPGFLPLLFDRFSQADGSAARQHGGLGLGLSIVKSLVEQHGGKVYASSDGPGRGATFCVRFILAELDATAVLHEAPESAMGTLGITPSRAPHGTGFEASQQGIRILLVEDHPDVLEVGRRLLCESGATVSAVSSADAALQLLRTDRFDVLLSDLGLPGMDGYELITKVRQELGFTAEQLPAAAVTAFLREQDQRRALDSGFQRCLQKPFTQASLARTVVALARLRAQPARAVPAAANAGAALSVLFVEDNADLREQIGWMLGEEGLEVTLCASAEEAIAAYKRSRFDLLITDISLPSMNGVELAKKVLARKPDAWVIFSTGYTMHEHLRELGRHVRVLGKPCEPDELHELIEQVRASVQ